MKNTNIATVSIPDAMPSCVASEHLKNACARWLHDRAMGVGPSRPSQVTFTPHTPEQQEAWRQRKATGEKSFGYYWRPRRAA